MEKIMKHMALVVAIEDTLLALKNKYKKEYVVPSQKTIMRLLKEYHNISISRSTLYRVVKEMKAANLVCVINRHRAVPGVGMEFKTNAYYILQRVGDNVKRYLRSAMRVASALACVSYKAISLTTKRDLEKNSGNEAEKVPIEWIRDFRLSLQ